MRVSESEGECALHMCWGSDLNRNHKKVEVTRSVGNNSVKIESERQSKDESERECECACAKKTDDVQDTCTYRSRSGRTPPSVQAHPECSPPPLPFVGM